MSRSRSGPPDDCEAEADDPTPPIVALLEDDAELLMELRTERLKFFRWPLLRPPLSPKVKLLVSLCVRDPVAELGVGVEGCWPALDVAVVPVALGLCRGNLRLEGGVPGPETIEARLRHP